ncbi:shikimate kinase AroL [Erwinia sp. HR93]|uniref:shikimate kinase AroL n=1 Tax=Erwinia sp. HR93 TaxID=3094840 RepID=UPI002ADEC2AF|nr:shikimate kinase AroL [Erwinia sp. HR93]MEA1064221.1 shikimate kinase AroL [Erwinia sp. HR93]
MDTEQKQVSVTMPLFLVGARGCGKTTVGEALSNALRFQFADSDRWLQAEAGMSVAEIVQREGWDGFRQRECEALQAVTAASTVIATGGGIVLAEANRDFMRAHGKVVYLQAPCQVLAQRLEAEPESGLRPTLTGRAINEEVAEVLAERESLYRQSAHYIVDAAQPPEQVVAHILAVLPQLSAGA